MPVCPRCGDLAAPLARTCDECGSYLNDCDAFRDAQIRMAYARRYRHPQPVDNSVEGSLLANDGGYALHSPA